MTPTPGPWVGLLPAVLCSALAGTADPLRSGTLRPVPPLRLPAERTLRDSSDSPAAVVFRHSTHVALGKQRCLDCHPTPFRLLSRSFRGRHAEMDAGQTCGHCHDGRAAFATSDQASCALCHSSAPSADPMAHVIALPRGIDSPGPASFSHRTHVPAAGRCSACHPEPFAMAVTRKPRAPGAMHAKAACGQCHDGRTAFSTEERCDGCHGEEVRR